MKVVLAHEVKQKVLRYAFFERNHMAAVTEGLNNADVLSITKAKYACEFEVKVSRSDLQKELAAIQYSTMVKSGKNMGIADNNPEQEAINLTLFDLKKKSGGWSKITKHKEYIDPLAYFSRRPTWAVNTYMPNYFYIVVPDKLVELAIEGVKGTGYGVIAYDGCRGDHYGYFLDGVWYERWGDDKPEGAVWTKGAPCSDSCYKEVAVKQKARLLHKNKVDDESLMKILQRAVTENIRMLAEIVTMDAKLKELGVEYKPEVYSD